MKNSLKVLFYVLLIVGVVRVGYAFAEGSACAQATAENAAQETAASVTQATQPATEVPTTPKPEPSIEMKEAPAAMEVAGSVVSVDAAQGVIVVKKTVDATVQTTEDVKLAVDKTAKIVKGDKEATLADIAAGDEVNVAYTANDMKENIASAITVKVVTK